MSRRAHRKPSPALWLAFFAAFSLLGGLGAFFFQKDGDPYRTVERLKPEDYYENANSLKGNTYQVEGTIANSLGWSQEKGRLFSFRVQHGGRDRPLPLLIPPRFREINLQKGQKYRLKVRVNDAALLEVEEMSKA